MLLAFIFIMPLISTLVTCLCSGAFLSLSWLWVLPVSYVGGVLFWAVLAFLFIYISAQVVNTEKPQEKDSKFYRFLVELIAEAAIPILSVKMHTQGLEKELPKGY